jgi:iron transport multicopper oxidase
MHSASFLLAAALLTTSAALPSIGPIGNLTITNAVIAPDGISRSVILAGGSFPGPVISAQPVCTFTMA